jgi:hypothetical protein
LCWLYFGTLNGEGAQVYSIDMEDRDYKISKGVYPDLHRSDVVDGIHYCNDIIYMDGPSVEMSKIYTGPQIGLLYIDASHKYEDVIADFHAWEPLCETGCKIVFDDFNRDNPGVMMAVMQLMSLGIIEPYGLFSQGIITCLT